MNPSSDNLQHDPGRQGPADPQRSVLERARLVLNRSDQIATAILLSISIFIMIIYVGYQYITRQGLIDIDSAEQKSAQYQIDINTAAWPEFANLPGIGEGLARDIVRFRETNGPFLSIEQLSQVPGIGPKKTELLRQYIVPIRKDAGKKVSHLPNADSSTDSSTNHSFTRIAQFTRLDRDSLPNRGNRMRALA